MARKPDAASGAGTLIIVGGHEEKRRGAAHPILREVARRAGRGLLVVATVATRRPAEFWREYRRLFKKLGVKTIEHLAIRTRREALDGVAAEGARALLARAKVVFFTGGDQLRITTALGGTELCEQIRAVHRRGGTIAGTSAGASVLARTMLVSGESDRSPRLGRTLRMAPGLGFLEDVIVDQHFAERGRLGRLLGGVGQNPRSLGVGIDENTAIVVEGAERFRVIGSGAVTVLDASALTDSNIAEDEDDEATLALFGVKLHLLNNGCSFDLRTREPRRRPRAAA